MTKKKKDTKYGRDNKACKWCKTEHLTSEASNRRDILDNIHSVKT